MSEEQIRQEIERMAEMLRRSAMLRTALQCGSKADVVLCINNGKVVERGPFVREIG